MQSDSTTRVLLGLIGVLGFALLAQRMIVSRALPEIASDVGRYEFELYRTEDVRHLLRMDTTDGAVWQRDLAPDTPWIRLSDEAVPEGSSPPERSSDVQKPPPADSQSTGEALAEVPGLRQALIAEAERRGIEVREPSKDLGLLVRLARKSNPPSLEEWALDQILEYEPVDSVPALLQLLDHPNALRLAKIVDALGEAGDRVAIEPLRELAATHKNQGVRAKAAAAVGKLELASKR